jgi:hypothetical protein
MFTRRKSDVTVAMNASEDAQFSEGLHRSLPYCTITSWILFVPIADNVHVKANHIIK